MAWPQPAVKRMRTSHSQSGLEQKNQVRPWAVAAHLRRRRHSPRRELASGAPDRAAMPWV